MNLNKNNGFIEFGDYLIKPSYKIRDLKSQFSNENLELWMENDKWITYRLKTLMNVILLIRFFDDDLKTIEIYLTEESVVQTEDPLKDLFNYLGGECKYMWGNVELNKDVRAGYESIVINMNK